jgi:hypothetical protein
MRHSFREAIDFNLDIFYTKTNKPGGHGRVDDDKSKNKHVECWLEFGQEEYGYHSDWEDGESYIITYHDYDLDCGGTTFDEALIALAKNIMKHYGDYEKNEGKRDKGDCGTPTCADCIDMRRIMKDNGM